MSTIRYVIKPWGRKAGVYFHVQDLIDEIAPVDAPLLSANQYRDLLVEELRSMIEKAYRTEGLA